MNSSITIGGGNAFVATLAGLITAIRFAVGNQRRPSGVLHEAGWNPPEQFSEAKPSDLPKLRHLIDASSPAAQRSKSVLRARRMPWCDPSQRLPAPSSAIW